MENNEDKLCSFAFSENEKGEEHDYRITANGQSFAVERDGEFTAELKHEEAWQQLNGEPLPVALVEHLGDLIEAHYC